MADLEVEEEYFESDLSDNEENHSKLLSSVSQLDSTQRVKPALRKEASSEVSEYNLTKTGSASKNLVNVKELAQVLGNKSSHASITKKFKKVTEKAKTLPKPLEKPVEERLKRSVGFENVKQQLRRWDAIVTRNALNDHLQFPLNDNSMKMQKSSEFLKQFRTVTPLEMKIAQALKQDHILQKKEEEKDEFPLTFEEMMEKRREMAQLRAKLSYKEAKAQRQSKIKSKKYHRILKREKLRQQLKEFELLQKTDPEAALKKLSELDKSRAQERASLRHRNTGQWAKNLTVRAKYDVESRKVLADQLRMSREITQKVHSVDSSDEEETQPLTLANVLLHQSSKTDIDNPWAVKVSDEVKNFVSGYKKYWSEKNKEAQDKQNKGGEDIVIKETSESSATSNGVELREESSVTEKEKTEVPESSNNVETEVITPDINAQSSSSKRTPRKKKIKTLKCPINTASSPSKRTPEKKKEVVSSVSIHPTSGVWIVTPIVEKNHLGNKKKRKADDIDDLFEDLNDKLMKKAVAKAKELESKLKLNKKRKDGKKKNEEEEFDLSMKNGNAALRPDMDVELFEGGSETEGSAGSAIPQATVGSTAEAAPEIDPKNFIRVTPKRLKTRLPDNVTGGEDVLDDEEVQQQMTIEEAFGDDDVIAEFQEMKEEEKKSHQIEITNSLPGWGTWGGTGIVPNPRKRKRLVLNLKPKKNSQKKDIIINENENPKLRDHLVKEVPHPFKSVEAFEASIRAPVGRDWVPESAHRKLIQKQVETKLGAVIEPMDEEELVTLKKKSKSPYKGKNKSIEK